MPCIFATAVVLFLVFFIFRSLAPRRRPLLPYRQNSTFFTAAATTIACIGFVTVVNDTLRALYRASLPLVYLREPYTPKYRSHSFRCEIIVYVCRVFATKQTIPCTVRLQTLDDIARIKYDRLKRLIVLKHHPIV